ncbi:MAG: hypothetical protein R3B09_03930 [Nannocystaceae bacterium]
MRIGLERPFGHVVALVGLSASLIACPLPDNPDVTATASSTTTSGETSSTGDPVGGLFGCGRDRCTFVVVSQTLDDRVDVYDVSDAPSLRGRIDLDLKPDPSGSQSVGNRLDEPYGLAFTGDALRVLIGHYPDTDRGSLVELPFSLFADLSEGGVAAASGFFDGVSFNSGVRGLELKRQEPIFALEHPSGRLLVGVFANDLKTSDWTTPGQLLVVDPEGSGDAAIGAVDLGALDKPCLGAWGLVALDDAVSEVGLACDGSESVAVLTIPGDLGDRTPADGAAAITGCGASLLAGSWTTRTLAPDGAGGLVVVQSQILEAPRFWSVSAGCSAVPATNAIAPDLAAVRNINELVLLPDASPTTWLAAGALPETGVFILQKNPTLELCGRVDGVDALVAADNAPYALAFDAAGEHLAVGAGPPNNPQAAEGRAQVLWATLDRAQLGACAIAATDAVDLNAGRYVASDPKTWARAPNVLRILERSGSGGS